MKEVPYKTKIKHKSLLEYISEEEHDEEEIRLD